MNRKILFRGKRLDNGQWVYGSLVRMLVDGRIATCICPIEEVGVGNKDVPSMGILYTLNKDIFMVDPATVGQYTGLTDKNGKKVFEGDIVSYVIVTGGIEELEIPANVRHEVTFDESHAAYKIGYHYACTGTMRDVVDAKNIIVIGNRWDNPELLKGGEE